MPEKKPEPKQPAPKSDVAIAKAQGGGEDDFEGILASAEKPEQAPP